MGKFIDMTGWVMKEHGFPDSRLTVIERAENKNNKIRWLCQCECGNKKIVARNELRNGDTKSCGCLNKEILKTRCIDLTGQKFERWTVLERAENHGDIAYWKCQCECGTIGYVSSGNLTSGQSKSCGCLSREITSKRNAQYFAENYNLVGQKFGKLTVIERTEERNNGQVVYKCLCDCGNKVKIRGSRLTAGNTQSCGCINSKGEMKVSQILRDNNIPFEMQKKFNDCRNPKTNCCFKFDFYIDNKYIIEYDGIQHFKECSFGHENLKERQEYDNYKNNYCKEHNIPLIRIPYTQLEELSLEDLLLETSKFLLKEV